MDLTRDGAERRGELALRVGQCCLRGFVAELCLLCLVARRHVEARRAREAGHDFLLIGRLSLEDVGAPLGDLLCDRLRGAHHRHAGVAHEVRVDISFAAEEGHANAGWSIGLRLGRRGSLAESALDRRTRRREHLLQQARAAFAQLAKRVHDRRGLRAREQRHGVLACLCRSDELVAKLGDGRWCRRRWFRWIDSGCAWQLTGRGARGASGFGASLLLGRGWARILIE